jgi:hypothetical protein
MGELAMATLTILPAALGPMCAAFAVVGLGVALWQPRRFRLVLLLLLLAVGYLVTFVAVVGYVYDRFLLGVALPAALLAAMGFDLVMQAIPNARARTAVAAGLLVLAIWPAIDLNWRIATDSRREVETWLAARIASDPYVVGAGLHVYLPNLHPFRHVVDTRPGVAALLEWDADLIVLNEEWLNRSGETLAGAARALETAGYQRVFAAGRESTEEPFSNVEKISPPLSVWQRQQQALTGELVPESVNRQNVLRQAGVGLELLPQPRDVDVDRARRRSRVIAPDLREQLVARDRRAAVLDEITEQVKLLGGELDGHAVLRNLGLACVHQHRAELKPLE